MFVEDVGFSFSYSNMALEIFLENAGKRFNRDWIFRNVNFRFTSGGYAIVGNNGSGKSTLLQCISGVTNLNTGSCTWQMPDGSRENTRSSELIYTHFSIAAPYLDLIEEMTAKEFLTFHQSFKPFLDGCTPVNILEEVQLSDAADKQIRFFSSGMKQRLKLAQAIFSQAPVLLLDEPCTNLDQTGFELYKYLIQKYTAQKLVIVSSNDENEYGFCQEKIDIRDFKKK